MSTEPTFGEELESLTETYLDRLGDCIGLLPELLDEYRTGGDYESTLDEIQEIESECDRLNRTINGTITNAGAEDIGLLNSRVHFNTSSLISFYGSLDVVANLTERIGQELHMIQPAHENVCFERMVEMAESAADGMAPLADVVARFIHSLSTTDESDTLTEEIDAVRRMESECDELRNAIITDAFDGAVDDPLLYREFAILLDKLANTMEDVTDQVVVIASNEPGIVTEPDPQWE